MISLGHFSPKLNLGSRWADVVPLTVITLSGVLVSEKDYKTELDRPQHCGMINFIGHFVAVVPGLAKTPNLSEYEGTYPELAAWLTNTSSPPQLR